PFAAHTKALSSKLLGLSIVGIGANLDLIAVAKVGSQGGGITVVGITAILGLGVWLGKRLGVARNLTVLIGFGTASCGGSAMAAVTPVLKAESHEVTMAMATVFLLNAVALILFPPLGAMAELSEAQFGLWAALAIHDTSSVVGATLQYGEEAL